MNTLWQEDQLAELEVPAIPPRVAYGDIWQLGEHRLLCGDSTSAQEVASLFGSEQFTLCFTSPPYSNQRTYKIGAFDWQSMMCGAFDQMIANGKPDCHILVNLGLKHENRQVDMYWFQWLMHCSARALPLFGWYTWDKGSGMPHDNNGRLSSTHEFIFHFSNQGKPANKWVKTLGDSTPRKHGRFRETSGVLKKENSSDKFGQPYKIPDSVIRISRANTTNSLEANHPAVFPVALPEFIYRTWSQPEDVVYEPFSGSGTSIISAERLHRRCYAIDIEPTYCDLAIERWQRLTGKQAVLIARTELVAS